ncbi:MAG: hypothetical protein QOD00_4218 [Blastocatellia bacterium]|nr:hypothetical protein [Blastocatellia bacterium]
MGEVTKQRRGRIAFWMLLPVLTLMIFLVQPREAQAQWATNGNNINNTNAGNVGVGTTTPGSKLHVATGGLNVGPLAIGTLDGTIEASGSTAELGFARRTLATLPTALAAGDRFVWYNPNGSARLYTDTAGDLLTMTSAGSLGLGTSTPGILNGINYSSSIALHIQSTAGKFIMIDSANSNSGLAFNDSSQPADNRIWAISQVAGSGKLTFSTYTDAGATSNKFVIDRSGNVGVGTMTPASKLHVAGNITVDGNINAKYQDVAEWVPASKMMPAGTVVVLDPEKNNQVMTSSKAYDTSVAGVVSAQPGIALGEGGAGKVLIATTGRVKVRVEATQEGIKIGDLLVTGEHEGVAMKSVPMMIQGRAFHSPGTLIGKALEPLEKGKTGEILVLLSLQ